MARYTPQNKEELQKIVADPAVHLGDIDTSAITDMSELFCKIDREDFSGIEKWDVSNVTDMHAMFAGCKKFNEPIGCWDVSKVTDMSSMFSSWFRQVANESGFHYFECECFNQPLDKWNVSKVTDMSFMFKNCEKFNQPLENWDVSNVTDMASMFSGCKKFNQPLNSWNVSSVTNMEEMFYGCGDFNQPLNEWDVSKVTKMEKMFCFCEKFKQDIEGWKVRDDVRNVLYCDDIFEGCAVRPSWGVVKKFTPKNKESLRLLVLSENHLPLHFIDTHKITDMSGLFECGEMESSINDYLDRGFSNVTEKEDWLGLETWDVSNVTDMREMFASVWSFGDFDLKLLEEWDVSNVKDMTGMFPDLPIERLPSWFRDTIQKKDGKYHPISRAQLDKLLKDTEIFLGDIDTSEITDMSHLFDNEYRWFLGDRKNLHGIENWDVSNVTNMAYMFRDNKKFNVDISAWNVSKVTTMEAMFKGCKNFNQDLGKWDMHSVENIREMFCGCAKFNQNLNNWDVSNVEDMSGTFQGCKAYNQPMNKWDVCNVSTMYAMFKNCTNFNQALTWQTSSVDDMESMFENCTSFNSRLNLDFHYCGSCKKMFAGATSYNGEPGNMIFDRYVKFEKMFFNASSYGGGCFDDWWVYSCDGGPDMFTGTLVNPEEDEELQKVSWYEWGAKSEDDDEDEQDEDDSDDD